MEISASEFKAKCLDLFDQLAAHQVEEIVVTKRGRPVAVLTPPPADEDHANALFGFMAGSVIVPADIDLTDPVLTEDLSAMESRLHG